MSYKRISDSELKVMRTVWDSETMLHASQISDILHEEYGWHPNTTYTIIKKCIEHGYIERVNPRFGCKPLVTREEISNKELKKLIDDYFEGSPMNLFLAILDHEDELTNEEIIYVKKLILRRVRDAC